GVLSKLCQNAVWLDRGSIRQSGCPVELIKAYLSQAGLGGDLTVELDDVPRQWAVGNELRLKSLECLCDLPLRNGEPFKARIIFETRVPMVNVAVGIGFTDLSGNRILTYDSDLKDGYRPNLPRPGVYSVDIEIDALPLQPFTYGLDIGCRSGNSYVLDYIPSAFQLEVIPGPATSAIGAARFSGIRLESNWVWDLGKSVSSPINSPVVISLSQADI